MDSRPARKDHRHPFCAVTDNLPLAYSTRVCSAAVTSDFLAGSLGRTSTTVSVRSLATSEDALSVRLQAAWDEPVGMLWMKPCLTVELLGDFRAMWRRYTAPSDDRQSPKLRELGHEEAVAAVDDIVALLLRTTVAAQAGEDQHLATLADLA